MTRGKFVYANPEAEARQAQANYTDKRISTHRNGPPYSNRQCENSGDMRTVTVSPLIKKYFPLFSAWVII